MEGKFHGTYMVIYQLLISISAIILLDGCATGAASTWRKPNSSEMDFKQDKYLCSQESRVGAVAGTNETRLFFHGQNKLTQIEANRLYRMCMEARGWIAAESQ